jgi:glycosyltransferase involved in cell wall biosynthesis
VDLALVGRAARALRALRTDLVHAHQYTPWFYAASGAIRGWSRPRILFTEHGRHYPDHRRPKRTVFNQALLPWTDGIVAVCGFVRDCLAANEALPRRRIRIIYNGVDAERFDGTCDRSRARAAQGVDPADPLVGIAARFAPVKDHATLLRAFARVLRSVPRAKLVLAGDGPLRESLETQARGLGIDSSCRFLGVRRDIPALLPSWDVFCLSSLSEGTSVTLLEAMACGLPVVATRVGGNPEIVEEGKTGLLAPRGDDAKLAEAIVRVLTDPTRARAMGEAGRARARSAFTLERMAEDYRALYRGLLAGERT